MNCRKQSIARHLAAALQGSSVAPATWQARGDTLAFIKLKESYMCILAINPLFAPVIAFALSLQIAMHLFAQPTFIFCVASKNMLCKH
ncbi:hypothetical protein EVAR_9788_1 [Eumeta japonica]|uniref:Uncharacterized protein n=1 Tax=Eumeta variegata TaxID=151549 RepID=A0A4C1U5E2_EUMVA|nr:hypothetical protein EVAR_9788_1 [Eumeta japonica]